MAIYHCSIKIISRGKGKSAVGAAAYRSGEKLTNQYDGLTHDYTKKAVSFIQKFFCLKMLRLNTLTEKRCGTLSRKLKNPEIHSLRER